MPRLIDADELIPSLKMGEVNADTAYGDGRNGGIYFAIWRIGQMPTIDAVPRQKYEEDMENAFAHGYTDAESNFRKMIADGELVQVVRCKDCRWNNGENYCLNDGTFFELCADDAYCSFGERRKE